MFSWYPTIRKVDKPDDKELLELLSVLIERTNDIYQLTQALNGEPIDPNGQLISPNALKPATVPEYIDLLNYIINNTRKDLTVIGSTGSS